MRGHGPGRLLARPLRSRALQALRPGCSSHGARAAKVGGPAPGPPPRSPAHRGDHVLVKLPRGQHVDQAGLPRVLQPDQAQLHLLVEEQAAGGGASEGAQGNAPLVDAAIHIPWMTEIGMPLATGDPPTSIASMGSHRDRDSAQGLKSNPAVPAAVLPAPPALSRQPCWRSETTVLTCAASQEGFATKLTSWASGRLSREKGCQVERWKRAGKARYARRYRDNKECKKEHLQAPEPTALLRPRRARHRDECLWGRRALDRRYSDSDTPAFLNALKMACSRAPAPTCASSGLVQRVANPAGLRRCLLSPLAPGKQEERAGARQLNWNMLALWTDAAGGGGRSPLFGVASQLLLPAIILSTVVVSGLCPVLQHCCHACRVGTH